MSIEKEIEKFSSHLKKIKDNIKTEEATKTAMIMPFFQLLGYDIFNPLEFVPEYTADVGIKKGERVDYAIMDKKQNPLILIEAKSCNEKLEKHGSQLFRYFSVTPAKIGILTNGLIYYFYSDLEMQNKMDRKPFLVIDMLKVKENEIEEIKRFQKENFEINKIIEKAEELKNKEQIKQFLMQQFKEPDNEFVSYILTNVYQWKKTQKVIKDFKPIIKSVLNQLINEKVGDRLQSALVVSENMTEENKSEKNPPKVEVMSKEQKESYKTVEAIVKEELRGGKLKYQQVEDNFVIMLDENLDKWICKFNFIEGLLYMNLKINGKECMKRRMQGISDLNYYQNQLCEIVKILRD